MAKFSELLCFVGVHEPDIILLTETWLKPSIPDSTCSIPGYTIYRCDSTSNPGYDGVCIYLKQEVFKHLKIHTFNIDTPMIDNIFLSLCFTGCTITVGCIYRPHASDSDVPLLQHMSELCEQHDNLVIAGDFNLPQLKWPLRSLTGGQSFHAAFAEMITNSNYTQLVSEPTRFREGQQPSMLDLMLVNDEDLVSLLEYIPPIGKSDHVCLLSHLQFYSKSVYTTSTARVIDYDHLSSAIQEKQWNIIFEEIGPDVDQMWQAFEDGIASMITEHSTFRTSKVCLAKPWITYDIRLLIRRKHSLWQRYRRSGSESDFGAHRTFSNQVSARIRTARINYIDNLAASGDKKKFFKYVRSVTDTKVSVPQIRDQGGGICDSAQDTSEIFALRFSEIFSQEPREAVPLLTTARCSASLENVEFPSQVIEAELKTLNVSTSPGPGSLTATLLKRCASSLSVPLSSIMEASFRQSTLPQAWKHALVTPIFKKGDKLDPDNYRPVSVVPIVAKIAEKVILKSVLPFLLRNNVLPVQQHGFIPGRSVITNLLTCVDDWTRSLDARIPVDVVYLDFSKAFDRVPRRRLLHKLEWCGIRGSLLRWIDSFLFGRSFAVKVGGALSSRFPVVGGVPQGSVLGPVLFLVYVSDLPPQLLSRCSMYADDMKLYGNPLEDHHVLQRDLRVISEWCSRWLLPLSVSKCTVLHMGRLNPRLQYSLQDSLLKSVDSQNDLGVIITSDLSWSEHILSSVRKASRLSYLFYKVFKGCSPSTAARLYTTYVRPILEFASPVWCPDLVRDANMLEAVQRRVTRLPYGYVRPTYEQRLEIMNLPSFQQRRRRGDLIITYRALHSCFGVDLSQLFELNSNNLRGHEFKLKKEKFSTGARQGFLSNRVFSAWNGLPSEVVNAPSVNLFKNRLDLLQQL